MSAAGSPASSMLSLWSDALIKRVTPIATAPASSKLSTALRDMIGHLPKKENGRRVSSSLRPSLSIGLLNVSREPSDLVSHSEEWAQEGTALQAQWSPGPTLLGWDHLSWVPHILSLDVIDCSL